MGRQSKSSGAGLIAKGMTVRGDISGNTDIEVHGEVVGDSNVNANVLIAAGGVWRGKLTARSVTVAGQVIGGVRASGDVEIAASARIEGTVTGGAIAVQQGAIVDGELKTISKEPRGSEARSVAAAAAAG